MKITVIKVMLNYHFYQSSSGLLNNEKFAENIALVSSLHKDLSW
jgi:hypothetical protein